jgi:mRNA-degrading endonuclease toxin of MazEF toxin-antitoxin module
MMMIGTMLEQGDILLVPIPFTDLSSQKRRPVIVVSNNTYNQKTTDLVVVAMTSIPSKQIIVLRLLPMISKKGRLTTLAKYAWTKSTRSPSPL